MSNIQYVTTIGHAPAIVVTAILLTCIAGAAPIEQEQETQPCSSIATEPQPCGENEQLVTNEKAAQWVEFQSLVRQWRSERGAMSLHSQMAVLPSYQGILGMGPDIVPFILAELESEGNAPDHIWFWALAAITHENPVPSKSRGKLLEMAKAWLEWGKIKNHVQVV